MLKLRRSSSDFEHIKPLRQDDFFAMALGCQHVPSALKLRPRFDAAPHAEWATILREDTVAILQTDLGFFVTFFHNRSLYI